MTNRVTAKLHFTEMNSIKTTDVRQYELSWTQIVARLLQSKIREDRDGVYLFGGQHFKPDAEAMKRNDHYSRCNDNVLGVDLLIVDVDNSGCTPETMKMPLEEALVLFEPLEYVCFTSFNHRNPEKDNGVDKFRFVFPLASYCPKSEWLKRVKTFKSVFGFADPASFTISQPFYPSVVHPQRTDGAINAHNQGEWFNWNDIEAQVQEPSVVKGPSLTTKTLDSQIIIKTVQDGTMSSAALFDLLAIAGTKVPCFSPFREEKNASAFAVRKNNGLYIYDMGARRGEFVPVVEIEKDDNRLILNRKVVIKAGKDAEQPVEKRETITLATLANSQPPPMKVRVFDEPLSLKARQRELEKFVKAILKTGLNQGMGILFAPEGYGKSYLVIELLKQKKKVVFGCQTNEQAYKKAEEFKVWLEDPAVKPSFKEAHPKVHWIWSKDYNFYLNMGIAVERNDWVDPFDVPPVSRKRTIQKIIDHYRQSQSMEKGVDLEALAKAAFDEHYKNVEPPSFDFDDYDVIVSTFTQVQILAVSERYRSMKSEWVIIFDDPGVSDVARLKPYDASIVASRVKANTQRERKGDKPLPDLKLINQDDHIYFVRQDETTLGTGFDYFYPQINDDLTGFGRKPPIVFTTTEAQTRHLIECTHRSIKTCDLMTDLDSGRITILGTNYVRAKYDGLIPVLVKHATTLINDGRDLVLIADGLGQALNHINNKGQNDLKECHVVVELSVPHPGRSMLLQHEFKWASKLPKETWSVQVVQGILMYDQMNQAIGRNAGYRYRGAETILLVDANRHAKLCDSCRYKISPYSIVVGQDSNADRQKKKIKPLVEYHAEISPLCQAIIDGLLDPYGFLASEAFDAALLRLENAKEVKKLILSVESFAEDLKGKALKEGGSKARFLAKRRQILSDCGSQLGRVD